LAEAQPNPIVAGDVTEAKTAAVPASPAESATVLASRLSAQQQAALAAMSGSNIRAAAREAGVCRATVYNWLRRDAAFRGETRS